MSTNFRPSGPIGSLDEYLKARDSLVSAEKALGYESLVERTPLESTAEEVIYRLKKWEDRNVYGIKSDGSGHETGHRFFHGLDLIPDSKLFAIATKAPKGCLLHCHYDCLLPPDTVLADARNQPNLYIRSDVPLISAGLFAHALPQFGVFAQAAPPAESNMFHETYRAFPEALWKFAQGGIMYAEIRVALNYGFSIKSDDGTRELKQKEALQILQEVLRKERPKIRAAGHLFYGAKVIYACMRSSSRDAMLWCMNNCIEMKQLFPDLICGFVSQGQEDTGHPLSYWVPDLLEMRAKITALDIDLSFILHAGETLDHGGETDSNLYDAILLDTKRIGHGFSITKHPLLMQICKERQIAIETCPISNEVLGLVPTTKSHHLPVLLANCVPCTVNSDDPGSWQ
ncbi:hypothetical protein A9Z42_0013010 [Trichoderma parareesei]|uniref:Adenosine deaminase domain-containing protein n=1 Tax=Trichoderma parareesei TaxID=858221 RepID=A0A2H2ZBR1_TRIPA|nr:hypothetical protein A9Z42_0013010 [Trichoderma parareesei]